VISLLKIYLATPHLSSFEKILTVLMTVFQLYGEPIPIMSGNEVRSPRAIAEVS
jgi:hypothetical protein